MAINRKLGNDFEQTFCEILSNNGFWTHNFALKQVGQPADIIAVKNLKAYLIDCKVCSNNKFSLSRIEDNQNTSMELWKMCGNGEGWFALKLEDDIFMIPHYSIKVLSREKSILNQKDIKEYSITIERWLR